MINYQIETLNKIDVATRIFVEDNHYSRTARSMMAKRVYKLMEGFRLVGVAIIGVPCGKRVSSYYGGKTLELRRLCYLRSCPKNTGSWFLSRIIKDLKKAQICEVLISYADPNFGHYGVQYQAANFTYLGEQRGSKASLRQIKYEGATYHMREVYQKDKVGIYRPKAQILQKAIKSGQAQVIKLMPKQVYAYEVKK